MICSGVSGATSSCRYSQSGSSIVYVWTAPTGAGTTASIFALASGSNTSPIQSATASGSVGGACASTQVADSDKASTGSISGNYAGVSVSVTCNSGYSGSGTATCLTTGAFSTVTCSQISCTATQVANSNYATSNSITGTTGTDVVVTCNSGYFGSGTATCQSSGSFTVVTCSAVACPLYSSGVDVSSGCTCNSGFTGSITATQSSPYYSGSCVASSCAATQVANSNYATTNSIAGNLGANVVVTCNSGYSGSGTATCQSSGSFTVVTCSAVACPLYSSGVDISSGCACNAGYSGTISGTSSTPFYSGSCVPNDCTPTEVANSDKATTGSIFGMTGQSLIVSCNAGYSNSGGPIATCSSSGTFNTITCSAVNCPANSVGTNLGSGCTCHPGYSGSITATTNAPNYFSGVCTAVACPSNSAGTNVIAGCTCNSGFSGLITATTSYPFYDGSCLSIYSMHMVLREPDVLLDYHPSDSGLMMKLTVPGDVFVALGFNENGRMYPSEMVQVINRYKIVSFVINNLLSMCERVRESVRGKRERERE